MIAEKQRIDAAADGLLPKGGAVVIDSGTATTALAASLPEAASVVAVTNSFPIGPALIGNMHESAHPRRPGPLRQDGR